jgi:hypothetical protein
LLAIFLVTAGILIRVINRLWRSWRNRRPEGRPIGTNPDRVQCRESPFVLEVADRRYLSTSDSPRHISGYALDVNWTPSSQLPHGAQTARTALPFATSQEFRPNRGQLPDGRRFVQRHWSGPIVPGCG